MVDFIADVEMSLPYSEIQKFKELEDKNLTIFKDMKMSEMMTLCMYLKRDELLTEEDNTQ